VVGIVGIKMTPTLSVDVGSYFVVTASPGRSTLAYYRRLNAAHAGTDASDEIDLTTCEVSRALIIISYRCFVP